MNHPLTARFWNYKDMYYSHDYNFLSDFFKEFEFFCEYNNDNEEPIFMESTYFTDCMGKIIYLNDILDVGGENAVVCFDAGAYFVNKRPDITLGDVLDEYNGIVVIGNLYEKN